MIYFCIVVVLDFELKKVYLQVNSLEIPTVYTQNYFYKTNLYKINSKLAVIATSMDTAINAAPTRKTTHEPTQQEHKMQI